MPAAPRVGSLDALEVLDSRGNPTLAFALTLDDGRRPRAGVPSAASTGSGEAVELRDGDPARFGGRGARDRGEGALGWLWRAEPMTATLPALVLPPRDARSTMSMAMGLAATANDFADGLYRLSELGILPSAVAGRGGASARAGRPA